MKGEGGVADEKKIFKRKKCGVQPVISTTWQAWQRQRLLFDLK